MVGKEVYWSLFYQVTRNEILFSIYSCQLIYISLETIKLTLAII